MKQSLKIIQHWEVTTVNNNIALKWLIGVLCFQAENPHAALNFYWEPLKKAVSIQESDVNILSVIVNVLST
jgi:hypothetical protein